MNQKITSFVKFIIGSFPKITTTYNYVNEILQTFNPPKETLMGFKFSGNKLMQKGQFEPEETEIVIKIIPHVDIFINVGANIGYYCCLALTQRKYVIAFEPITLNLRYLLQNIKANGWESQIEIYPVALSNKVGAIEIYGGGTGASLIKGWASTPDQYVTLVPSLVLDTVLGRRFNGKRCFVLVDIEGAEKLMLEGASLIINMVPKPIWMVEISISEHQPKGVKINPNLLSTFHVFWNAGYEAWTANKKSRIVHSDEIEQIVRTGINTLDTHNFLFLEKDGIQKFLTL